MKNRKGTLCKMCKGWVHDGCMYNYSNGARIHFVCNKCTLAQLPFSSDDIDLPNFNTNGPLPYIDDYDCFMKTGLHFIHVNARSLLPKLAEIRILANKIRAAVITSSESWLDDTVTDDEVKIDGYNIKRLDRNRKGGGVCAYIRNDLAYSPRPDLNNNKLEILWFEVLLPKTKPILVGTSYRPPTQDQFLEDFSRVLSGVENNCETIILGDFNICFQQQNNGLCKRYKQILGLNSYTQLINTPTRITQFSATLIDHILCNHSENISQSGVITTGLSDHFIIYCTRKITRDRIGLHRTIKMRSTRNYSKETLVNRLHNCDWTEITSCTDVNDAWEKFKTMFTTILDNIAPVKEVRIKRRTEPWMNTEILDNMKFRDQLLKRFKANRQDIAALNEFQRVRNRVQRLIKGAKAKHYCSKIEEYKHNPRKLWQQLKQMGYSHKPVNRSNIVLTIDNEVCHETSKVANCFNSYYTSVASTLVSKLPAASNTFNTDSDKFQTYYTVKAYSAL
ncbi:uncharacterized protein [Cherax quadricarinatus]|uniref:uncharacterized protein isoform X1 n=1 Tax=Cherax quadricarinatus TaxID=27406 RepID=UPI00387E7D3E